MYFYALLFCAFSLSAMEQPSSSKQEILQSQPIVSFSGVKKSLSGEHAQQAFAYLTRLAKNPVDTWTVFGENFGTVIPGLGLTSITVDPRSFGNPLVQDPVSGIGLFYDYGCKQLVVGKGFGPNIELIGYLPQHIQGNSFGTHCGRFSPGGSFLAIWNFNEGASPEKSKEIYLISLKDFDSQKEIVPAFVGDQFCYTKTDLAFLNDSGEFVFYDSQNILRGYGETVSQKGFEALKKVVSLSLKDKNLPTNRDSVLQVFAGGALLAFGPGGSARNLTIYDMSSDNCTVFKEFDLKQSPGIQKIITTFNAQSFIIQTLDNTYRIGFFDTAFKFYAFSLNEFRKYAACLYSPDGTQALFYDQSKKLFKFLAFSKKGIATTESPVQEDTIKSLRWLKSGIYCSTVPQGLSIKYWDGLGDELDWYREKTTKKRVADLLKSEHSTDSMEQNS
jgi:hypothetical protein